jgi:3-mercaptopyruvate sulfurtransferase SseA
MRLLFSMAAAAVLGILVLSACNSNEMKGNRTTGGAASNRNTLASPSAPTSSQSIAPSDGVRRFTVGELKEALDKGTALVVDVRPATSYQQSHIKGSINIPLEEVTARVNELPRDKTIVTYCS